MPEHRDCRPHRTQVDCGWQVIADGDRKLLQLSTYGSDERQSGPKVSQTIQVDRLVARNLVRLLTETFDL